MHMPRLENPADSPHAHHTGCFAWKSSTLQLWSVETNFFSGRCQHFRITVIPMAYTLLCLRFTCLVRGFNHSATGARLDTGGWLDLTRQGLSPCKVHQAALGALTFAVSGRPKRGEACGIRHKRATRRTVRLTALVMLHFPNDAFHV